MVAAGIGNHRQANAQRGQEDILTLGSLAVLRKIIPFEADATSDRLGWESLEAARYRQAPDAELNPPGIAHDRVVLFSRPPEKLELLYEGVNRRIPPSAGSISLVPAGSPAIWRWSGRFDWLHVSLEPRLVTRVAAEAFELDAGRLALPPLDDLDSPELRATMGAVDAELTAGGFGGRLAAESLANLLAVQLIRHVMPTRRVARRRDGPLPTARLRAVVDYIEDHLEAGTTLEQMAAVAKLSAYHFARQFKSATGLPPHQYVVAPGRTRQAAFARWRRIVARASRHAGWFLGPEYVLTSLQAHGWSHACALPRARKIRLTSRKKHQEM